MPKTAHTYDAYKQGYEQLLETVSVKPSWTGNITNVTNKIVAFKDKYKEVENAIGVPWRFVGVIHSLECGLDFGGHLHNGNSLSRRTTDVPRGYPKAKPQNGTAYTWLESAVDALKIKGLDKLTDWSDARVAYELERFNGFGYRQFHINSPYLWSGSNHYSRGKYVSDRVWSSSAVSKQTGAMLLYLALKDKEAPTSGSLGKAEVKELKTQSQGFAVVRNARDFLRWVAGGVSGLGLMEYLGIIKDFLTSWQGLVTIGLVLALTWAVIEWLDQRKQKDVAEGRHIPSGAVEDKDAVIPPIAP